MIHSILLVDDDAVIRKNLPLYFLHTNDFAVVATVEDGDKALEWLRKHRCDIVLSDIHMPGLGGRELLRELNKFQSPPIFVGITAFDSDETMLHILANGGAGYIIKSDPPERIVQSLRACVTHGLTLSQACIPRLVERTIKGHPSLEDSSKEIQLDAEQIRILELIRQGYSNAAIGKSLSYAESSIKRKVSKLFEIFGASNRTELVLRAEFHRWGTAEEI